MCGVKWGGGAKPEGTGTEGGAKKSQLLYKLVANVSRERYDMGA